MEEHLQLTQAHVNMLTSTTKLLRQELVAVGTVVSNFSAVSQRKHSTLLGVCGYLQQYLAPVPNHDQEVMQEEEKDSYLLDDLNFRGDDERNLTLRDPDNPQVMGDL